MILFLASRMSPGFGVSVVVEQVVRRMKALGKPVMVGCHVMEGDFGDIDIRLVPGPIDEFLAWFEQIPFQMVVAHTSPFFELLPHLAPQLPCYAWEHGDPTPEFFDHDQEERKHIILHKQLAVYPQLTGVFAISEFIMDDIDFPAARVIYNGCDHMPDLGPKGVTHRMALKSRPLSVGTLMRLGYGEAKYKGNLLFQQLKDACRERDLPIQFEVMGRGSDEDASTFREQGIAVWLNADEQEKIDYLRRIDVFISCSQWEGFNLPLVEAQALGTVGLAFDVGAHPEVTPMVMRHPNDVTALLSAYVDNPDLLLTHSRNAYHFVRRRFKWNETVMRFLSEIEVG
jgi:glycosyltransferase involved in cell wall biosynthesis